MSKGLEALERLKNCLLAEGYWQDALQDVSIIEYELEVLEIIKKKRVNLDYLRGCKTLEDYNNILIEKWQLTETEFSLIKEVLEK